jgi:hypothetical protein
MPSIQEENTDPVAADEFYKGATRLLREITRTKSRPLLLKENIAYGFHRNMMALRYWGITSSFSGIFFGAAMCGVFYSLNDYLKLPSAFSSITGGLITLVVSLLLLVAWTNFTERAVKQSGYCYAERLFEELGGLPKKRKTNIAHKKEDENHAGTI